ncbi:MAG: hypothetical protein ACXABY_20640 [Candidatus Thorarchaeota archaeon]|jgi:hypothetical protein
MTRDPKTEQSRPLKQGEPRRGMVLDLTGRWDGVWVISKATPKTASIAMRTSVDMGPKYRGKALQYRWDGRGYVRQGGYLWNDGVRYEIE